MEIPAALFEPAHEEHDLALHGFRGVVGEESRRDTDAELFERLRQFPRDTDPSLGKMRGADFERLEQTMRRFEEDARNASLRGGAEVALAPATFYRQEAAVVESLRRKSAADQRREHRAGAGDDGVRQAPFDAGTQEPMAGIADAGKPRDFFAGGKLLDEFGGAARFVVFVVADERLSDFKMREQVPAVPRVFARDQIDRFQNLQRAECDVTEVSDRRGDEVEHRVGRCFTTPALSLRSSAVRSRQWEDTPGERRSASPDWNSGELPTLRARRPTESTPTAGQRGGELGDGLEAHHAHRIATADRNERHDSECEQIFFNIPLLIADDFAHGNDEEDRYLALGRTDHNRRLYLVFTIRGNSVRVISARDMTKNERLIYEKSK